MQEFPEPPTRSGGTSPDPRTRRFISRDSGPGSRTTTSPPRQPSSPVAGKQILVAKSKPATVPFQVVSLSPVPGQSPSEKSSSEAPAPITRGAGLFGDYREDREAKVLTRPGETNTLFDMVARLAAMNPSEKPPHASEPPERLVLPSADRGTLPALPLDNSEKATSPKGPAPVATAVSQPAPALPSAPAPVQESFPSTISMTDRSSLRPATTGVKDNADKAKIEQALKDIEHVRALEYARMKEVIQQELLELRRVEEKLQASSLIVVQQKQDKLAKDQARISNSALLTLNARLKDLEAQVQQSKNARQKLIEETEKTKIEKHQVLQELAQLRADFFKSMKEKEEILQELEAIKRNVSSKMN